MRVALLLVGAVNSLQEIFEEEKPLSPYHALKSSGAEVDVYLVAENSAFFKFQTKEEFESRQRKAQGTIWKFAGVDGSYAVYRAGKEDLLGMFARYFGEDLTSVDFLAREDFYVEHERPAEASYYKKIAVALNILRARTVLARRGYDGCVQARFDSKLVQSRQFPWVESGAEIRRVLAAISERPDRKRIFAFDKFRGMIPSALASESVWYLHPHSPIFFGENAAEDLIGLAGLYERVGDTYNYRKYLNSIVHGRRIFICNSCSQAIDQNHFWSKLPEGSSADDYGMDTELHSETFVPNFLQKSGSELHRHHIWSYAVR
jgi:hypothetical protein